MKHLTHNTGAFWALAAPLLVMVAFLAWPQPAEATSLYAETRQRFGYGVSYWWGRGLGDYPNSIAALNAGWYTDFTWQVSPMRPAGLEYVQVLTAYREFTEWDLLAEAVAANPGSLWIVGNEPDRQEPQHPRTYAQQFHDFHAFIKARDPSARLANSPLVQATPLRMRYVDDVFHEYEALYGEPMPVDVWATHEQILREVYDPTLPPEEVWGCYVPRSFVTYVRTSIVDGQVVTNTYSSLLPIYCDNSATGMVEYCAYDQYGLLPSTQSWTQGEFYGVTDNANPDLLVDHVQRMRQWMKDHGQREKPLMITEYGVLLPSFFFPEGDEAVLTFMRETFAYMLGAIDATLGCPADGNRLVQAWNWFGLNIHPDPYEHNGYNGGLAAWDADVLTIFGEQYAEFTNDADPRTGTTMPSHTNFLASTVQYITTTFTDADGWGDLDDVYLLLSPTESPQNAVYLRYDPDNNRVFLRNTADTAWLPPEGIPVGNWVPVANENVELFGWECQSSRVGNTVTVRWGLKFKPVMAGKPYRQWLMARDKHGMFDGWDPVGVFGIGGNVSPLTGSVSPSSGKVDPYVTQLFQSTYTDLNGVANIESVNFLLNTTATETNGVYARYDPGTNLLYLRNEANTAWLPSGGMAPGSLQSASHGLATLHARDCAVTRTVDTVAVTWALAPGQPMMGTRYYEFLKIRDTGGLVDGWDLGGNVYVRTKAMAAVATDPAAGWSLPGTMQLFTGHFWHEDGWDDIKYADLLVNVTESTINAIYLRYDVANDKVYLRLPGDTGWRGGGAPGSVGTVRTNYATLDYAGTAVQKDGDTLRVTWAVIPSYRTSGKGHQQYLRLTDIADVTEGWRDLGDWIINRTPNYLIPPDLLDTTVLSTPDPANPNRITFNPRYRDLDKSTDLRYLYLAIADTAPTGEMGANAAYVLYDQLENKVYLANSAGTAWLGAVAPGTTAFLENNAVKVTVRYSFPGDADVRTKIMYWRLEFKPGFQGSHKVYMRAIDRWPEAEGDTGWKWKGTLEVVAP